MGTTGYSSIYRIRQVRSLLAMLVGLACLLAQADLIAQPVPQPVDFLTPYIVSQGNYPQPVRSAQGRPLSFSSLAELTQQMGSDQSVEALNLYNNAVRAGQWHQLRALSSLRLLAVYVPDTTVLALDSLLLNLASLPRLEALRISFFPSEPPARRRRRGADTTRLKPALPAQLPPQPVAGFPRLQELRLSGDQLAAQQLLGRFTGHPGLARVELWGGYEPLQKTLPDNLGTLPNLTHLLVYGRGWQGWETAFRGLSTLRSLTLWAASAGGYRLRSHVEGNPVVKAHQQRHMVDLNRGLAQLTSLRQLDLTAMAQVDQLHLAKLPALTHLRLQNVIPGDSTFLGMKSLESLTFEECDMASLPTSICDLSRLTELRIQNTNAPTGQGPNTKIPVCLGRLESLTALSINNHSIHRLLLQVGDLPRLQRVELTACALDTMPLFLTHLPVLRYLDLRVNALSMIPDTIQTWRQLDTLLLSRNRLRKLPDFLPQLKQLRMLAIQSNQLQYLPDRLGNLDSLRQFAIGDNALRVLPPSLSQLRQLQSLTIGKNLLNELPAWLGQLTGLTELGCELPLTGLPSSLVKLKGLRYLYLRRTRLRFIPAWIGSLSQLTNMSLESDELQTLPESFGGLTKLEGLSITGQKFSHLPASVGQLSQLKNLSINGRNRQAGASGGGRLTRLPASLVRCKQLYGLILSDQPELDVVNLFTQLAHLPSLGHVELRANRIRTLPPMNWTRLRWYSLNLAENALNRPPSELAHLPDLQLLDLRGNPLPESLSRSFHNHQLIQESLLPNGVNR